MFIYLRHKSGYAWAVFVAVLSVGSANGLSSDVQISIQTIQDGPYLPGIPIPLRVEVRNTGITSTSIPDPTLSGRDNPYNSLDIMVGTGTEGDLERIGFVEPNLGPWKEGLPPAPPPAIELQPNEVREVVVPLSYDWVPHKFKSLLNPGVLRVQAVLCDYGVDASGEPAINRANRAISNILKLEIVRPDGAEAKAWSRVNESERPWLLAHPAALENITQDTDFLLFQEISNLGTNVYSRYAAAVVAYMFAVGNALDLHPGRPPQPQVAKQWLDKAMDKRSAAAIPREWVALSEKISQKATQP